MEVPHAGGATGEEVMEVMYPRCAGLDVHKDTVVACVRLAAGIALGADVCDDNGGLNRVG